jgi:DNA-binding NarL/FixJ family response regulator
MGTGRLSSFAARQEIVIVGIRARRCFASPVGKCRPRSAISVADEKTGRPPFDDVLTPAEWRVCESVRHGLTNPAIARRLGVSVDAVKYHVANALQKLGLRSRKQLWRWR